MQASDILIDHMLLKKYLIKSVTSNAYKVQVYLQPGALSRRLDEGEKLTIQLPQSGRVARNNHRAREGGRAGGKRTNEDEDGEEDGNAPESSSAKRRRRRRSSSDRHQASSSAWVPAAALEMDFDSDMEGNVDEDSEFESEDIEWKGNLRGAPAVTHRTLRNRSSAQKKPSVPSAPLQPIYDEVIDITSE
jgi:hypothetical protein